jgi:hypothetical protein
MQHVKWRQPLRNATAIANAAAAAGAGASR